MKNVCYVFLLLSLASCQYFETDKISSDTFYEEELKTISWQDVDQFPTFTSCEKISEKETSKICFESTLLSRIQAGFTSKHFVSTRAISDTLWVGIEVSDKGKIALKNIEMDSITRLTFPKLSTWIQQSIDSIPAMAPAHKRGIPVRVSLQLPVVLKTE